MTKMETKRLMKYWKQDREKNGEGDSFKNRINQV